MRQILKFILLVTTGMFFVLACNEKKQESSDSSYLMPNVSGKFNEVLVVMNNTTWESQMGKEMKDILKQKVPALPQPEPMFDVVRIEEDAFSKVTRSHRNIIRTEVHSEIKKPTFNLRNNVWAKPQIVIELRAPTRNKMANLIDNNSSKIENALKKAEEQRIMTRYRKNVNDRAREEINITEGVDLMLPNGYSVAKDTGNFVWIANETRDVSRGIFIYHYDYEDTSYFNKSRLLEQRDKFLKKYVPGEKPNSYMKTEEQFPVTYNEIDFNGKYAVELRGLWNVENDFMGGPFVSYSTVDNYRNRLITVEGWVYAPKYNKRNYLRKVIAILNTFEVLSPKRVEEIKARE